MKYAAMFLCMAVLFSGCEKEDVASPGELNYFTPVIPPKFPPMEIPADNPLSEEGVELGRMLFYDPVLDASGERSCASCHNQSKAFSTPELNPVAVMPQINLAWDRTFLWRGEVEGDLEDVMLFEVRDFFQTDLDEINTHPEYPALFRKVFGVERITHEHIAKALAQFERVLISADSKFDRFIRNEAEFTESEYNGYVLFFSETGDCFHCHGTALFKDNLMHNNGLDESFTDQNIGRFAITGDSADIGKFKAPTLRNIALTAPYMHDNRFETLEEVIDFYAEGVYMTRYTDPLMNHEGGINLSQGEKEDLAAFLKTLTDSAFVKNPAFSNPF